MNREEAKSRIILASDFGSTLETIHHVDLAKNLHGLKVGRQLVGKHFGWLVDHTKVKGVKNLFFDERLNEGVDQMKQDVNARADLADYLSIDIQAGTAAMRSAINANEDRVTLVGSTIASDMSEADCVELHGMSSKRRVAYLGSIAARAGLTHLTASGHDLAELRQEPATRNMTIFATGIILNTDDIHDQQRVSYPSEAIRNGADYLVIGRAITMASDPERAIERIAEDMMLA